MKRYPLGAKPHKVDERDWLWRDKVAEPTALVRKFWTMGGKDFRMDQGSEGTCVGHGITNVLVAGPVTHETFPQLATVDAAHQFARQLYLDASGDTTYSKGCYTRDALDVVVKRGQAGSYLKLQSVDEVIAALDTGPVVFASPWYESMYAVRWYPPDSSVPYLRVNPASGLVGYHLYALTGKDLAPRDGNEQYVRMENSWGKGWSKDGLCRIKLDDLHVLYDGDAYVLTEAVF